MAPRVVVDLEPQLLTQLLRRMLATRGVATVEPAAAAGEHVDVELVGETSSGGPEATFTVRLEEAGWTLPANVVVEAADPARSRLVEIAHLDDLIDLVMNLASD